MIRTHFENYMWRSGRPVPATSQASREGTMAYQILAKHNQSADHTLMRIRFDALISHDITYVGIIQTARASGLTQFPLPYVLTNCHNSLCAVGGTINEDDHVFGLSAAKKFGGTYVPANVAVIHQYAREKMAGVGRMILGSDSHTRYGALGTLAVGEGGPELAKQLLSHTYDIVPPQVVLVYVTGTPKPGIGPHDVAIALCSEVFKNSFAKNKILEFAGPGIARLPMDFRIGIDVMTTETTCLSSIWETDEQVEAFYENHGRKQDYAKLAPKENAGYDGMIEIDLSEMEAMIALPFHPSNAYPIKDFIANAEDLLHRVEEDAKAQFGNKVRFHLADKVQNGQVRVDQAVIAGCAGGMFDNIAEAADILDRGRIGCDAFSLSVYPSSLPISLALQHSGIAERLTRAGAVLKPCFCGPCFGAGDVPANNGLSIRHTTRNFPNREGSKPGEGQLSAVALMDARSIAATAANGGILTAATEMNYTASCPPYHFDTKIYENRVYDGFGKPDASETLVFGPNIADWPKMPPLADHLLIKLAAVIHDDVTTTDELIPSGETSSYRSNPTRLAEFALSRRVPTYVADAKAVCQLELERQNGDYSHLPKSIGAADLARAFVGSAVFATKPGDGSAREQAASCQKVLGGCANICYEYATKRYRSNCINWGLLPFTIDRATPFDYEVGDWIWVPNIRAAVDRKDSAIAATVLSEKSATPITLRLDGLTEDERQILLAGCLINYYAKS